MRIKTTVLLLSALLPLSALAMPEQTQQQGRQQGMQGQKAQQGQMGQNKQQAQKGQQQWNKNEKRSSWSREKMQQRQNAWFDRLELTAEQREQFQKEMSQRYEQQRQARAAHHDKLRALLTDEQRVIFDQDIARMEQRMQGYMQRNDKPAMSGQQKPNQRNNAQ